MDSLISCVHWVGHGRLSESPEQYELAPAEVDELVARQGAMNLEGDLMDKHYDDEDDSEDEEAEMEGLDKLGKHISTQGEGEGEGEGEDGDEEDQGDAAEDDAAMGDDAAPSSSLPPAASASSSSSADSQADALLGELKMDDYDDEPEGAELFLGGQKLTVHQSNAEDPYITVADEYDEDSDEEDTLIRSSDCVLCVGRTERDHSSVEVYVYDADRAALFVHHDFQIPSFPLAFQFLSQDPRSAADKGAFLAVATFLPGIEIWNLNVLDVLEPVCTLGGLDETKKKKRLREGSHEDAVLCLGWHEAHAERLASGGADELVKLWDVTTQQCTRTLTHHRDRTAVKEAKAPRKKKATKPRKAERGAADDDESWYEEAQVANQSHKVQSLHWNPTEPSLLLTGSYDRSVHLVDVRAEEPPSRVYAVDSDVEMVRWHPLAPLFLVATESGLVYLFDARNQSSPLFRLSAHDSAATCASFNPRVPSLFMTSSRDKSVKLWSIPEKAGDVVQPALLSSKEMRVGEIWTAAWDVDEAALMACGGDKGKVAVWDIRENGDVMRRYAKELAGVEDTGSETSTAQPAVEAQQVHGKTNKSQQQIEGKKSKAKSRRHDDDEEHVNDDEDQKQR